LFKSGEKYSAILGYKTATDTFGRDIRINENIIIKGQRFKVIGIFEEMGNPEDDSAIEVPIEILQELLDKKEEVTAIELIAKETYLEEVAKKATRLLERKKGEDTVDIITPDQLLQQFSTILSIVNTILGAIAGISLVVGGVGIMNSIYTSVMERKKEIGIMKAIGARNRVILILFLTEAAIIGFMGGIIGIAFGYGIGKIAQFSAELSGFKILIITANPILITGSILFAVLFGLLAGFLPAQDAMKKQIVEVLRKK
jgi:putative ABC transport system permease protein